MALAPKTMADIVESVCGAVYVDSGFDWPKTAAFVAALCAPVWKLFLPNVPLEPVRLLRERLPVALKPKWKSNALYIGDNILLWHAPERSWRRECAHRVNQMLDVCPALFEAMAAAVAREDAAKKADKDTGDNADKDTGDNADKNARAL